MRVMCGAAVCVCVSLFFQPVLAAGGAPVPGEAYDPVATLYEKGNEYFRRGSYNSAISVFELVAENHPEHLLAPESLFSIASAKHKMGDGAGAKAAYESLIKKYPAASANPDALLQLGTVQSEMGDLPGARSSWSRLIRDHRGSIASKIAEQRMQAMELSTVSPPLAPARPIAAPVSDRKPESPLVRPDRMLPSAMPSGPAPSGDGSKVYIVKRGDSLSKIAKQFLGSVDRYKDLAKFNKIPSPYTISPGQEIRIPTPPGSPIPPPPSEVPSPTSMVVPPVSRPVSPVVRRSFGDPFNDLPIPATSRPAVPAVPAVPTVPAFAVRGSVPGQPAAGWMAQPFEELERAAGVMGQRTEQRTEAYDMMQNRLETMQKEIRGQKLQEKQLEILKARLEEEQRQNTRLKQEIIQQVERLKDMKDRNVGLLTQVESLTTAVDRGKTVEARAVEQDMQIKVQRQKMDALEQQNQTFSETLQKMRNAFDAQMALIKTFYDSQLARAKQEYESRLETTVVELSRLRDENRQKEYNLSDIKKDYSDLIRKTTTMQKEIFEEKQSRVSVEAAKQSLERAQDLRRQGKMAESEAAYKEALSVYPESADAMNGLAYLYAESNRNLDEAEKLVERAISVDAQGKGYYLDTWGWILYTRTAYTSALDRLLEAHKRIPVEDLPARAAVHYHLGKVYQSMADKDKAFFHFIDAIKMAPRTRWASLAERELDAL